MKSLKSLRELAMKGTQVNRDKNLEKKISMLPLIPDKLSFDSNEIAGHIARNPLNVKSFGRPILDSEGILTPDAHDFFLDQVSNDSECLETYDCFGSGGEFGVSIMEWRGIFWVQAPEFDHIGYFLSVEEAAFYALDIAESYPA